MLARARRWAGSLRGRLLLVTLAALAVALALAGVLLAGMFRDHVSRQFGATLVTQLDQVTARLEFDTDGQPRIDGQLLSDPRWSRPYSGLYWQLDALTQPPRPGVLRSRSLWDSSLPVAPAGTALAPDSGVDTHQVAGPDGARLLQVSRTVKRDDDAASRWQLRVAGDLRDTEAATQRFNGALLASLAVLMALLCAAALAQVAVGLAPLRALQRGLAAVRDGRSARLDGRFPDEVQPLVDDFNGVLERNAEVVARARTQAGNLAHALRTPLTILSQAATGASNDPQRAAGLAAQVLDQVGIARRHIDWQLARARAAAAQGLPGAHVELAPVIAGLLRVMAQVHAERGLRFTGEPLPAGLAFAGEVQDLQEMLGNLLDNACKWARHEVRISGSRAPGGRRDRLLVVIDDDGPGIEAGRRDDVMARGARLDESVPGSGLGLAIVNELAGLYGGSLSLATAPSGGLRVELALPAAAGVVESGHVSGHEPGEPSGRNTGR